MKRKKRERLVRDEFERDVFYVRLQEWRRQRHCFFSLRDMPSVRINGRWMGYFRASHLLYCTHFRRREAPRNDPRWRKRMNFESRLKYDGGDIPF